MEFNRHPKIVRGTSRVINRIERIASFRSISHPYLSGDLFASKADVRAYNSRFFLENFSLRDIKDAKVIFCPSDEVVKFFYEYKNYITAKVIILGNSDFDFESEPVGIPRSVKQIFATNVNFKSNIMQPIPIGVENARLAKNGKKSVLKSSIDPSGKIEKILIGPFSPTHAEREELFRDIDANLEFIEIYKKQIYPKQYSLLAGKYKYIACPRGNGLDTHRFWESLYRESYPIVKESFWSNHFRLEGIPLLEVNEWSSNNLRKLLSKKLPMVNRDSISPIWWPYWESKIKNYL